MKCGRFQNKSFKIFLNDMMKQIWELVDISGI